MKYVIDFDILDFEFWGGAQDAVEGLSMAERIKLEERIVFYLQDREVRARDINDFVEYGCTNFIAKMKSER